MSCAEGIDIEALQSVHIDRIWRQAKSKPAATVEASENPLVYNMTQWIEAQRDLLQGRNMSVISGHSLHDGRRNM